MFQGINKKKISNLTIIKKKVHNLSYKKILCFENKYIAPKTEVTSNQAFFFYLFFFLMQ